MVGMADFITCPGCGAFVESGDGPVHAYIGAPAGCWKVFGMVLEREYGEYQYPEDIHRLTVDTYAVQHPGQPGAKAQKSVNLHLLSLYLWFEKKLPHAQIVHVLEAAGGETEFPWLTPPRPNGKRTVLDVLKARSLEEHSVAVEAWAADVWQAWAAHHGHVAALAERFITKH